MRIFRSLEEARHGFSPSAVTIGNFDGVHAGHRELMRRTVRIAEKWGVKPSALTFTPHPTRIVAPERAPKLLTTPEERCALMAAEGIEQVLILPFDRSVASLQPRDFVRAILQQSLGAKAVVVGDNFHFGKKQSGHVDTLSSLGPDLGIEAEIVPAVWRRGVMVSSSEIRRLLVAGKVAMAGRLLERPFSLSAPVVRGEGRGSKQTVPTLNLDMEFILDEMAVPATGVYVTRTHDLESGSHWRSITNVGYRPTFGGRGMTIETYLFTPALVDTPGSIKVEFLRRVRAERRFASAGELKSQILHDVARAQTWFRRLDRSISATTAER
jgi:riboflavin kinase/FMN adenylyltransferase